MKHKTRTCLIRLSDEEMLTLDTKSSFLGKNKSALIRDAALSYWADSRLINGDKLLKIYQDGDDSKEQIINLIFQYLRRHGYPHNKLNPTSLNKTMNTIARTKSPLLDDDNLQRNTVGLNLANYFHPHMVTVRCLKKYLSPQQLFDDDVLLKDAIKRWLDLGNKPNLAGMRRILRTRDGTRSVVNFKPAISKFIYDTYAPANGRILDPCAGYGGRLAGCIASNKGLHYHGIDPDGRTATGNMKMAAFFSKQYDMMSQREWKFGFSFDLGCAEDVMIGLGDEKYDLVFSSPPYFGVEQYSNEINQSYLRYPEYDQWRESFLKKVLVESFRVLRNGGVLVWNVKDYKKMKIAEDSCKICLNVGFVLEKVFQMHLSNSEYRRGVDHEKKWHTEPIFVFRKSRAN